MNNSVTEEKPFFVQNGSKFEIHAYEYEGDRRWEKTIAGPVTNEHECRAQLSRIPLQLKATGE
jgi:hypothetical protein